MALSEFVAMETAYSALQQLDAAARLRALRWLNDALGITDALPRAEFAAAAGPLPEAVAAATGVSGQRVSSRRPPARTNAAVGRSPAPTRTRPTAASEAPRPRRSRQRQDTPAQGGEFQRAYRRMPPPKEVFAAYRQAGTLTGVAEHFGVPRHTVQGWARRLRDQGQPIGGNA